METRSINGQILKQIHESAARACGHPPDLELLCAQHPEWSASDRLEIVLVDQHHRWRLGQSVRAEEYLERFPDLAAEACLAVRIVVEEFGYLEADGQSPNVDGFVQRFPGLNTELREELASLPPRETGSINQRHDTTSADCLGSKNVSQTTEFPSIDSSETVSLGTMIGPYRVDRLLGLGAFGEVWLAQRRGAIATTSVALKLPVPSARMMQLVKTEAQTWVRASGHPNIVPILDADIYGGRVVIASEYIADGSLQDLLQSRSFQPMTPSAAISIVTGILIGLEHLHGRGILHRDLKPANVMLQEGFARLTDFGLSRPIGVASSELFGGTPTFMAPEAFNGERTAVTDLWSVAVIFYQLLTGRLPYSADRFLDLVRTISDPRPVDLPDSVPEVLREFLAKALCKDPAARYQSAAEMRSSLAACNRELGAGDAVKEPSDGQYLTIAITGSMRANPDRVRQRLATLLRPFYGRRTSWYVGTWGTVDEFATEQLATHDQQMLLVGYQNGDISPRMNELIARYDLPFVDAAGLGGELLQTAPIASSGLTSCADDPSDTADLGNLSRRDIYFLTKVDLVVLVWDGISQGTKELLTCLTRVRKAHLVAYV